MMPSKHIYIDLFSGCGGLALGLYNSGWKGLFAIEKSNDAFATLRYNLVDQSRQHFKWPNWLPMQNHDINDILLKYPNELKNLKGQISLVAGGPPCQGFSLAGKRDEKDVRNKLVDSYIEFIKIVRPTFVFFENVTGFTYGFKGDGIRGKSYSLYVVESLQKLGYDIDARIVDFSEFGVPQKRKRFILVGSLFGKVSLFFDKIESDRLSFLRTKGLKQTVILEEAISDLLQQNGVLDSPDSKGFKAGIYSKENSFYQTFLRGDKEYTGTIADSHRFANHRKNTILIFKKILENADRNKRLDGELRQRFNLKKRGIIPLDKNCVSPTLTTHPDDYIHYCEPRILTVREYARIQSFPDWFEIKGRYTTGGLKRVRETPRYSQLGNAIPPLFSEQVGLVLKELVNNVK